MQPDWRFARPASVTGWRAASKALLALGSYSAGLLVPVVIPLPATGALIGIVGGMLIRHGLKTQLDERPGGVEQWLPGGVLMMPW